MASGNVLDLLAVPQDHNAASPARMEEANELWELAQSIAEFGSWKVRLADHLVEWSDQMYRIYGVSRANFNLTPQASVELLHPEDRAAIVAAAQAAMTGGPDLNMEHRILRPDGEVRYVHSRGKLMSVPGGKPFFAGTVQDITERRISEAKLRESETLVRIAGQIARMGGWEIDVATSTVRWSDEVCEIHEVPRGSRPSLKELGKFYTARSRKKMAAALDACISHGLPFDEELEILTAQGKLAWVRAIGRAVQDYGSGVTRICGAVQDITEKRRAEEKALRLSARLTSTLENITDAFITLDQDWRFTYINPKAAQLLRREYKAGPRKNANLLGKRIWEVFPDAAGGTFHQQFHRALHQNCTVEFEEFYAPLNQWLEVLAYPSPEGLAIYLRDVSERKRLQEAIVENEERFRIVAKVTSDTIWDWDLLNDTIWWNEGMQTLFGYMPQEIETSSLSWSTRIHPQDKDGILAAIHGAIESGEEKWSGEYRFRRKDGSHAFVLDRGLIIRNGAGKAVRMVGSMTDLTSLKKAEQERQAADARIREQASLLDKAKDAIIVRGMDNRIHFWNKGAERLYGWSAEEALGRAVEDLLVEDFRSFFNANEALLKNGEWNGETTKRRKDGTIVNIEVNWTLVYGDDGRPKSIFAIETDITRRKVAENEIQQLAYFDPLTRLPNRMLLMKRLHKALNVSARRQALGALLFIDLDNFKSLNDSLGHDQGDLLLRHVASRLIDCVHIKDTVARLGGDEFVVMLEELGTVPAEAAAKARTVGERILHAFTAPFQLTGSEFFNTPSIGIALFDGNKHTVDDIMKRADVAMYQAKSAGRNTMRFFDPQMQAVVQARMALEKDLRQALLGEEFTLYYQPQLNAEHRITGVEALLRWKQPQRGMVAPGNFIPLAEDTGLIVPVGNWVLQNACRQLARWAHVPHAAALTVAVNVSARQFRHPDFVGQVISALATSGADPCRLKLELTESLLVEDLESTIEKMDMLKALGVGFALDDFGTGYSSLSYLKRLPLDQLKIDQSFVNDMLTDPNGAAIVRTIIALGSALGLGVIAEGVETREQRKFLVREGCTSFQGFHFSRPLPPLDMEGFMLQGRGS